MPLLSDEQKRLITSYMFSNNLTQDAMANELKIKRPYLNLLLNKNKEVTTKVAIALESTVGRDRTYWVQGEEDEGQEQEQEVPDTDLISQQRALHDEWVMLGGRTLVDSEIITGVSCKYLEIESFKKNNVEPASYAISIDKNILVSRTNDVGDFNGDVENFNEDGNGFWLSEGQYAAVRSKEYFKLPANIMGTVSPTSTFIDCQKAIHLGATIHPGFHGIIYGVIYNTSTHPIQFTSSTKPLRVTFTFLPRRPSKLYSGPKQELKDFPESLKEEFRKCTKEK